MFKRIFPAPETWDKLPPESNRQRKIGNLCMAGVLLSANALSIGAAIAANSLITKWTDKADEQLEKLYDEIDRVENSPATQSCAVDQAVRVGPSRFMLYVSLEDDPVGTNVHRNWGPIHIEREITGKAGLEIGEQQAQAHDYNVFEFDAGSFPEGSNKYDVSVTHDSKTTGGIGRIEETRHRTLQDPCGSVTLGIRDGSVEHISIP